MTPVVLQRKRKLMQDKRDRAEKNKRQAADYSKLLAKRQKEQRDKRQDALNKRRRISSTRESVSK